MGLRNLPEREVVELVILKEELGVAVKEAQTLLAVAEDLRGS